MITQIIFIIDIILKFFLARKKEGDEEDYIYRLEMLIRLYYKEDFGEDLLLAIPFGFLGNLTNSRIFIGLHLFKGFRIKNLFQFLQ